MTSPDSQSTVEFDRTRVDTARLKWCARAFAGLVVLGVLVSRGDGAALFQILARVPTWMVIAAVFWYLGGQFISALKWRILLRAGGGEISLRRCCALYWLGMFSNLWLPGTVGGDAIRIWKVRASGIAGGAAAASVVVERSTGFAALLLLGAFGLALDETADGGSRLLWIAGAALVAIGIAFFILRGVRFQLKRNAVGRKVLAFIDAVALFGTRRGALALAGILSLVFQASQILLGIGLARAVGLALPAPTFIWLVPMLAIASLVPVGIGGLGVREVAAVALVGEMAPAETVVAWSLLWQGVVWISSVPGAWWAWREK